MVANLLEDREAGARQIRQLQHMVELLPRSNYGPRREQVNENRLFCFAAGILENDKSKPESKDQAVSDRPERKGCGRQMKGPKRARATSGGKAALCVKLNCGNSIRP